MECVQGASSADGEPLRTGGSVPGRSGRRFQLVPLRVARSPWQPHDKCLDAPGLNYVPPRQDANPLGAPGDARTLAAGAQLLPPAARVLPEPGSGCRDRRGGQREAQGTGFGRARRAPAVRSI